MSTEQRESFDAYHIWLGIPPEQQPANHYRLLGLEQFESNPDVIDAAANRQTAYLHQLASGPHRKESQKLLTEIAAARRCLLDPTTRVEYDEKIRMTTATKALGEPALRPIPDAEIDVTSFPVVEVKTDSPSVSLPRRKTQTQPEEQTAGDEAEKPAWWTDWRRLSAMGLSLVLLGLIAFRLLTRLEGNQPTPARTESMEQTNAMRAAVPESGDNNTANDRSSEPDAAFGQQPETPSEGPLASLSPEVRSFFEMATKEYQKTGNSKSKKTKGSPSKKTRRDDQARNRDTKRPEWLEGLTLLDDFSKLPDGQFETKESDLSKVVECRDGRLWPKKQRQAGKHLTTWIWKGRTLAVGESVSLDFHFGSKSGRSQSIGLMIGKATIQIFRNGWGRKGKLIVAAEGTKTQWSLDKQHLRSFATLLVTRQRTRSDAEELVWLVRGRDVNKSGRIPTDTSANSVAFGIQIGLGGPKSQAEEWIDNFRCGKLKNPPDLKNWAKPFQAD